MTLLEQLLDDLLVTIKAMGLVKRTFVILESQPGHAFENGIDGFRGGALQIGVLDAQDKLTAMFAGIQPGKQGSAGTANVQITGGAGGKTGANGHIRQTRPLLRASRPGILIFQIRNIQHRLRFLSNR